MTRPMRTSRQGLDLIRSFEGFRARSSALGGDRWLIGYGHTKTAREGLEISEDDAAKILRFHDLPPIELALNRLVLTPLNQNQFDALASFTFNLGLETFRESDVLAHLNAGEPLMAATAMGAWRKADVNGRLITVDALVRRRAIERALFLESPRGRPAAPTPIVRPIRDVGEGEPPLTETPRHVDVTGDQPRILKPTGPLPGIPAPPQAPGAPLERTSEETARRIGERVTRILHDSPGVPPDSDPARPSPTAPDASQTPTPRPPKSDPPPSVGDIQAAVAAIADPLPSEPEPAPEPGAGPDPVRESVAETLPPPPEPSTQASSSSAMLIDDLEPLDLHALESIGRPPLDRRALAAYGFAFLFGAVAAFWGLGQVSRVARGQVSLSNEWQMLVGPFAVVLGTVLAALMAYQLVRMFLSRPS